MSVLMIPDWAAEAVATSSPSDELAYCEALFLVEHPEAPVSTDADYPTWTPGQRRAVAL